MGSKVKGKVRSLCHDLVLTHCWNTLFIEDNAKHFQKILVESAVGT